MEKEIYYTRVLPLIRYEEYVYNGKKQILTLDNLTREELLSLSDEKARMLWSFGEELYVAEQPLALKTGKSMKFSIVYLYDELTEEEKIKYYDRTIVLPLTKKPVVQIYGENSKRFFSRKIKVKKEAE